MPNDVDIPFVDHRRLVWNTEKESLLGQGSFGIVYRGAWNGTPVAIKVVKPGVRGDQANGEKFSEPETAARRQHRREIHRLAAVQNPYIIQYLGVFRDPQSRDLYIVTEFLEGGSLYDSLCRMRARDAVLDDRSFLQIACQMAYGLNHVHSQRYTHGDMKPQNILLSASIAIEGDDNGLVFASFASSAKVKVADFGLSKRLDGADPIAFNDSTVATTDFGTGPCGTFLYMSPEAYVGVSELTDADAMAADVYAYGLILFELLSGLQSWSLERVRNPIRLHLLVRDGTRPSWGGRRNVINSKFIELVERCWSHKSEDRPTAEEIVNEIQDLKRHHADELIESSSEAPPANQRVASASEEAGIIASRNLNDVDSRASLSPSTELHAPKLAGDVANTQDSSSVSEDDVSLGHASSGDGGDPTIVPVESMKRLTHSQVLLEHDKTASILSIAEYSQASAGPESTSGIDGDCQEASAQAQGAKKGPVDSESAKNHSLGLEKEGYTGFGMAEIDRSVIGGVSVMRVHSVPLRVPEIEPLQVPQDTEKRATMGTGSIAGNLELPCAEKSRTGAELLASFMIAGAAELREDENSCVMKCSIAGNVEDKTTSMNHDPVGEIREHDGAAIRAPTAQGVENDGTGSGGTVQAFQSKAHSSRNNFVTPDESSKAHQSSAAADLSQIQIREDRSRTSQYAGRIAQHRPLRGGEDNRFRPSNGAVLPPPPNRTLQPQGLMSANVAHQRSLSRQTNVVSSPPFTSGPNHCGETSSCGELGTHLQRERPLTSLSKYRPHGTMTGHGATAPPLSDTAYSAAIGATGIQISQAPRKSRVLTWSSRGPEHCLADSRSLETMVSSQSFLRGSLVGKDEVFHALQTPDASMHLHSLWNRGCKRAVAAGLAQARNLIGNEILQLACDFLGHWSSSRRDPLVDKDLCTAIGNATRNTCKDISQDAVLTALRVAVSTMFAYRPSFLQNEPYSVEVYTSCNFALCNLFKANNIIQDSKLRTELASWILYIISWNIYDDGASRGPHAAMLSYAATSAARNFMWMNEENVAAFTKRRGVGEARLVPSLIASMKYFNWTGSMPALEACLSAIATAITVPQQRTEFMTLRGIALVIDVLERRLDSSKIAKLVFSMITVLISLSGQSQDEVNKLEQWCRADQVCSRILALVDRVQQDWLPDKESLETLQMGFRTLRTCGKFSGRLCGDLVDEGAVAVVVSTTQWLSMLDQKDLNGQGSEEMSRAMSKLGQAICELVQQLSTEPEAKKDLKNQVSGYLEKMLPKARQGSGEDKDFV